MSSVLTDTIQKKIIDYIESDIQKKTPLDIKKYLKHYGQFNPNIIKTTIKHLVLEGQLEYTQEYGRTFLEKSFNRPTRVSENIVLKPPELNYTGNTNDFVINILKGISFGRGSHPTTCLSLQAIDTVLNSTDQSQLNDQIALDIGTGSGVLAIAASKIGIGKTFGCDIDPISLSEAKKNISLNNLDPDDIVISETINHDLCYDYIFANLRFPTLVDLSQLITETISRNTTILILSGFKISESSKLENLYIKMKWQKLWQKTDRGWSAMVLKKPPKISM